MVRLIVLDQMISSMTEFKQIIGRGTRLRYDEGKKYFVVMDFRNVTRLFADPDWDGPIEVVDGFEPGGNEGQPEDDTDHSPDDDPNDDSTEHDHDDPEPPYKPYVDSSGCRVEIIHKTVSIYDPDGKLLRQESVVDYTRENVQGEYASLDNFIREWRRSSSKEQIRDMLTERGIDLSMLKKEQNMSDVDDFDFLCYIAFGKKPLTRRERANNVKKRDFFSRYSGTAREVLEALLEKYKDLGIYEIEKFNILKLDPLSRIGKPQKIAGLFGGLDGFKRALSDLESAIYEDEAVS